MIRIIIATLILIFAATWAQAKDLISVENNVVNIDLYRNLSDEETTTIAEIILHRDKSKVIIVNFSNYIDTKERAVIIIGALSLSDNVISCIIEAGKPFYNDVIQVCNSETNPVL